MFQYRGNPAWLRPHPLAGDGDGRTCGAALVPGLMIGAPALTILFSPGDDDEPGGAWEHVSVSTPSRTPTWAEMSRVKALFWGDEDCVVEFHPPRAEYVNNHPFCLHLWRWTGGDFPRPPKGFV